MHTRTLTRTRAQTRGATAFGLGGRKLSGVGVWVADVSIGLVLERFEEDLCCRRHLFRLRLPQFVRQVVRARVRTALLESLGLSARAILRVSLNPQEQACISLAVCPPTLSRRGAWLRPTSSGVRELSSLPSPCWPPAFLIMARMAAHDTSNSD